MLHLDEFIFNSKPLRHNNDFYKLQSNLAKSDERKQSGADVHQMSIE